MDFQFLPKTGLLTRVTFSRGCIPFPMGKETCSQECRRPRFENLSGGLP